MRVSVSIQGLDQAVESVEQIADIPEEHLPVVLELLATTMEGQTKRRWDAQAGPDGPWAPLKESTLKRKKKGTAILVETGRLRGSITHNVVGDTAYIGTPVFYGSYHQFGTRKMVARPFLGLTAEEGDELEQVLAAYIESVLP